MHKIILDNGIFKVKEIDADGNSVQIFPQEFVTEADARAFIDGRSNTNTSVGHQTADQTMGARAEGDAPEAGAEGDTTAPANTETAPQ